MADVCASSSSPAASWKGHPATQEWENLFPSPIKEMMGYCMTDKVLNRRSGNIKFRNFKSSAPCHIVGAPCDRMVVCVPYCGTHVQWEVIFSYLEPTLPPDLVFAKSDFNPDIERLTVLSEWSPEDPSMLALLLQQVLEQFAVHSSGLLSQHQRLQFELHTLEESEQYSKVEVLCHQSEESKDEPDAVFYIPLPLNLKGLPDFDPEASWKDDVVLVVKLSPPNASHAQASVLLTSQLEKVIGSVSSLTMPVWGSDCNPCLMDYVPLVHQGLQDKVDTVHRAFEARKEYIATWLSAHEAAVLEYDTEGFTFVSFLFEIKGFYSLVHFELTKGFPVEAPIITVRSVYHKLDSLPCESQMKHYHFNSQWSAEEMVERTKKRLTEILPKFKELSVVQGECLT